MDPIFGQAFSTRKPHQIHKQSIVPRGYFGDRLRILSNRVIARNQIGTMRRFRLLKGHRRNQYDASDALGNGIQQAMISGYELRQPLRSIQCLHLPELRDQDRCANRIQLGVPISEIEVAPLIVHRISLPGHRTKARLRSREFHG